MTRPEVAIAAVLVGLGAVADRIVRRRRERAAKQEQAKHKERRLRLIASAVHPPDDRKAS